MRHFFHNNEYGARNTLLPHYVQPYCVNPVKKDTLLFKLNPTCKIHSYCHNQFVPDVDKTPYLTLANILEKEKQMIKDKVRIQKLPFNSSDGFTLWFFSAAV